MTKRKKTSTTTIKMVRDSRGRYKSGKKVAARPRKTVKRKKAATQGALF